MTLFEEFKKGLKAISVEEVLDLVFYRPLAFVLVKAIYHTQITPNQLTLASMVLGIVGGAAYAFGTPLAFVVGAVFYLLYDVVDCSDGQLARLKHAGTPIGRILDGVADYTASLAAYVGIGIGYACRSDHVLLMWLLTAAAGFSNAIQSGLLDFYRNRYLDIVLGRTSILDDEQQNLREAYEGMKVRQEHALERGLIWIYLRYSAVQRGLTGKKRDQRPAANVNAAAYIRENRVRMHFWTYLGPTTQWTFLIICSFLNRLDVYLWGILVGGNIGAIILSLLQNRSDLRLHLNEAA